VVRRFALDTGGGDAHPRRQLGKVLLNSTRTSERRINALQIHFLRSQREYEDDIY
jgi:hypothetical protein